MNMNLNQTPTANQPHIALFGNRNAGKSSLLNRLVGQEISLVSPIKGTTTDPVQKTMELIPFGPVVFIDTAGLDDEGELGQLRVERTLKVLQKTDLAIYVTDVNEIASDLTDTDSEDSHSICSDTLDSGLVATCTRDSSIGDYSTVDSSTIDSCIGVSRTVDSSKADFYTSVYSGTKERKMTGLVSFEQAKENFRKTRTPFLRVINKIDQISPEHLAQLKDKCDPDTVFVSSLEGTGITELREILIQKLECSAGDPPIIGDLLPYNSTVVLVVPIDSEAPKGRIILPQVQVIRDCLDHGIKCHVVRDTELESALRELPKVDLVITDSQAFKQVSRVVPSSIPLTSFSILFARHKGDLMEFIRGASYLESLPENARILMMESCSHNHSHEDIGRFKIPNLLSGKFGKNFQFDFKMGQDFPQNLKEYDLVIHCGSCMLNKKTMDYRVNFCRDKGIPITNYGIVLAYLNGIMERAVEIFKY